MHKIYFKKLSPTAIIPSYGNDDNSNAGIDIYSNEFIIVEAHSSAIVHTGIAWEFAFDYEFSYIDYDSYGLASFAKYDWKKYWKPYLQIKGRSGLAFKYGVEVTNAGVVDQDYRGEITCKLYNHSEKYYTVNQRDRVAQAIPMLIPKVQVFETDTLSITDRGHKGFGSTGK